MNRPDLRQLECFVAVAEERSFSRAARRLHLSQPPLSRQVRALEENLGVQLLRRDTRSVTITTAGASYLDHARALLLQLDRAGEAALRIAGGESRLLRLAFIGALLDRGLTDLLRRFRQLHPACRVDLRDLSPAEQLAALRAGEIDGGFIGALPEKGAPDLEMLVWKKEKLLLAFPAGHPLAGARTLGWSRLAAEPWIMVSREAASAFRTQFARLCADQRIHPRVVQEAERLPAVLTMVAAGGGISLVPETAIPLVSADIILRPAPSPKPTLTQAFARRKSHPAPLLLDLIALF